MNNKKYVFFINDGSLYSEIYAAYLYNQGYKLRSIFAMFQCEYKKFENRAEQIANKYCVEHHTIKVDSGELLQPYIFSQTMTNILLFQLPLNWLKEDFKKIPTNIYQIDTWQKKIFFGVKWTQQEKDYFINEFLKHPGFAQQCEFVFMSEDYEKYNIG